MAKQDSPDALARLESRSTLQASGDVISSPDTTMQPLALRQGDSSLPKAYGQHVRSRPWSTKGSVAFNDGKKPKSRNRLTNPTIFFSVRRPDKGHISLLQTQFTGKVHFRGRLLTSASPIFFWVTVTSTHGWRRQLSSHSRNFCVNSRTIPYFCPLDERRKIRVQKPGTSCFLFFFMTSTTNILNLNWIDESYKIYAGTGLTFHNSFPGRAGRESKVPMWWSVKLSKNTILCLYWIKQSNVEKCMGTTNASFFKNEEKHRVWGDCCCAVHGLSWLMKIRNSVVDELTKTNHRFTGVHKTP